MLTAANCKNQICKTDLSEKCQNMTKNDTDTSNNFMSSSYFLSYVKFISRQEMPFETYCYLYFPYLLEFQRAAMRI